ncbi:MAG: SDR family oxidoreductase [Candidatus Bathyarchaeota archaeon]|nr:SDR family oxidoreductase [Candidatus Bathyarchaeota archaeon]
MRILVTGHLGYIGTVMVPLLQAEGHEITGLDSDIFKECKFIGQIPDVPFLSKDIRDVTVSDLKGFNVVIHLAALSNDPLSDLNPKLTYDINYKASVKLAKLARKAGVERFLFSSSCSVYGDSSAEIITEKDKPNPLTAYAESKLMVEQEVSKLADTQFSPTLMRSATAYGVSPKIRFDLVMNNLVAWAYTSGVVLLKSDGLAWRPIVHIEDISRAFIAALQAPKELVHNQTFNVGITEENYQVRELANIVKETVPNSNVEYAKDSGPDKRSYKVDFSKIKSVLPKFKPKWSARAGAKQLYEAYVAFDLKGDEFEGPRFKRLEHLKQLMASNKIDSNLRWNMDYH